MSVWAKICLTILWLATFGGIVVMKKVEPRNYIYPIYALLVAAGVTLYVFSVAT